MLRGRHQFIGSIPGIHRHRPQRQLLRTDDVDPPLATMIAFAVTRARWFIPAVVDQPATVSARVAVLPHNVRNGWQRL